jgi:hypothetical protein
VRKKRVALEFSGHEADFRKALGLLDDVEGRWALPGRMTIIIDYGDLPLFKDAGLSFKELPVVPMSEIPPAERAELRRKAWGLNRSP